MFVCLIPQRCNGKKKRNHVARAHACPHAVNSKVFRQYNKERYEEKQLSGQGKEYGELRLADALKKILNYNLTADNRIKNEVYPESAPGNVYQCLVYGKQVVKKT